MSDENIRELARRVREHGDPVDLERLWNAKLRAEDLSSVVEWAKERVASAPELPLAGLAIHDALESEYGFGHVLIASKLTTGWGLTGEPGFRRYALAVADRETIVLGIGTGHGARSVLSFGSPAVAWRELGPEKTRCWTTSVNRKTGERRPSTPLLVRLTRWAALTGGSAFALDRVRIPRTLAPKLVNELSGDLFAHVVDVPPAFLEQFASPDRLRSALPLAHQPGQGSS